MRRPTPFALLAVLPALATLAAAAPHLLAYSTQQHFLCTPTSCDRSIPTLSSSALNAVLQHLSTWSSSQTSWDDSTLPLSKEADAVPELVLLLSSHTSHPASSLLSKLSTVAPATDASGFSALAIHADLKVFTEEASSVKVSSVAELKSLAVARDSAILSNNEPDLISLNVAHADIPALLDVVHDIARDSDGRLAVVWAVHADDASSAKSGTDEKSGSVSTTGTSGNVVGSPKSTPASTATTGDSGASSTTANHGDFRPPEINAAQLSGLLVAGAFLLMFIPGFLCLYNIQTPQTFAMLDSNEMKKKMQ